MLSGTRRLTAAQRVALKRLAIQLAAQLPDDPVEAVLALDYTKDLIRSFLAAADPDPPHLAIVKP